MPVKSENPLLDTYLETLREHLPEIRKRFQVHSLEVFGSHVHHRASPESDLDILVTFEKTPGLLAFLTLENHLSDLLGVRVDLVMRDDFKPKIGERILADAVPV